MCMCVCVCVCVCVCMYFVIHFTKSKLMPGSIPVLYSPEKKYYSVF